MKSEIQEVAEQAAITFPCLMQSTDSPLVVRFTTPCAGVVVIGDGLYLVGQYREDWVPFYEESEWQPFTGKITLSND